MTATPTNSIADAIAEELHRRGARLAELREEGPERVLMEVRGEVIGLRGALGIALGHRVQGGEADAAGINYYETWLGRQHSASSEAGQ